MTDIHTEWGAASTRTYTVAKSRACGTNKAKAEALIRRYPGLYLATRTVSSDGTVVTNWTAADE